MPQLPRLTAVPSESRRETWPVGDVATGAMGAGPAVRRRLVDRALEERAKGIVMAQYGMSVEPAGRVLHKWAEEVGVTITEMATGVIAAGSQPFDDLPASLQDFALRPSGQGTR